MWHRQAFPRPSFQDYPSRGYSSMPPRGYPSRMPPHDYPSRMPPQDYPRQYPERYPTNYDDSVYDMMYQQSNESPMRQRYQKKQLPQGIQKLKAQAPQKSTVANTNPLGVKKKTRPNKRIRERKRLEKLQKVELVAAKNVKKVSVTPKKTQKAGLANKKKTPEKPKDTARKLPDLMKQKASFMPPRPQRFMQQPPQHYMDDRPRFMQPPPQQHFMQPPPQRYMEPPQHYMYSEPYQQQAGPYQQYQPEPYQQHQPEPYQRRQIVQSETRLRKKLPVKSTRLAATFIKKTRPNRRIRAEIKKRKLVKQAMIAAGKAKASTKFEGRKYRAILEIPKEFSWPVMEPEDDQLIIDELKRAFEENVSDQYLAHMRKRLFNVNPTWDLEKANAVIKKRVECFERYKGLDVERLLNNIDSARIKKISFYIKFSMNVVAKAFEQDDTDSIELVMINNNQEDERFLAEHILLFCKMKNIPACRINGLEPITCQLCDTPQSYGLFFKKHEDNPLQEFIDFVKGKIPDIQTEVPDIDDFADVLIPILKKNAKEATRVKPIYFKAKPVVKNNEKVVANDVAKPMEEEVADKNEEETKDGKVDDVENAADEKKEEGKAKEEKEKQDNVSEETPKKVEKEKPAVVKKTTPVKQEDDSKKRRSTRKK